MDWSCPVFRAWIPIATGVVSGAVILFAFRKSLAKLIWSNTDNQEGGDDEEVEEQYVRVMARIVAAADSCPFVQEPTQFLDFLYIGSEYNAKQVDKLQALGITHVINTVDGWVGGNPQRLEIYGNKFDYLSFLAQDRRDYLILKHFKVVHRFIEDARMNNGKVLIHCSMGINRSGALAAAYIMVHKNQGPLSTVQEMKTARGCILTNSSFQEQLVHFASRRGLLALDRHFLEPGVYVECDKARESLEQKIRSKDNKIKLLFKEISS